MSHRPASAPGTPSGAAISVGDIMSTKLATVGMDDSLATVRAAFEHHAFHHLLVVEEGRLVGVVSDRDLLRALSPTIGTLAETARDAATLNKRVHQIMSRKPLTLQPTATLADAVAFFSEHRVSCIPIVDGEFHACGIVSWRDLLRAVAPLLHASGRRAHP